MSDIKQIQRDFDRAMSALEADPSVATPEMWMEVGRQQERLDAASQPNLSKMTSGEKLEFIREHGSGAFKELVRKG